MKGDFSKSTFRPEKQYDGVRLQQGRVLLDSEWNEQQDILAYLRRTTNLDVIGSSGVPRGAAGFQVIPVADDFILTPGRMYVDGVLVECPAGPPLPTASALTGGAIVLNAWPVDARDLRTGRWLEVTGNLGTDTPRRVAYVRIAGVTPGSRQIAITGSTGMTNHMSVRWVTSYLTQPNVLIAAGSPPLPSPIIANTGALFYIDVWSRHLTALEEPSLREVALGGPDTATRTKVIWRVSIKADTAACGDPNVVQSDCRLAARSNPAVAPRNVCEVPSSAGYRGVENQLYRVEIHEGADLNVAGQTTRFKWSRDNGSIAYAIEGPVPTKPAQLRLVNIGRDERTSLKSNDWVELLDDVIELSGRPGPLFRVETPPDEAHRIVTLNNNIAGLDYTARPRLRLWTGVADLTVNSDIHLENGVEIRFTGPRFISGDYWTIPARSAFGRDTGDVEWPNNGANPPAGFPLRPEGIRHAYAPLAVLMAGNPPVVARDCRRSFAPLTDLVNMFYVSGDAQEVMPDPLLPNPRPRIRLPLELKAGVFNGRVPADAKVRFRITTGDGMLFDPVTGTSAADLVVSTRSGIASVAWDVGTSGDANRTVLFPVQVCEAWLLNANDGLEAQMIRYHARLALAENVAFVPHCEDLKKANANTVQKAIDVLCERECGVCTINVRPSVKWEELQRKIDELRERAVEICFAAGEYASGPALRFNKRLSYVKITGAGDGTRISSSDGGPVFTFEAVKTVIVRDLHAENDRADSGAATIEIQEYEHVVLEQLSVRCAPGREQKASCVFAKRSPGAQSRFEMRQCRLTVGRWQVGLDLDTPDRAFIKDNAIVPVALRDWEEILAEPGMPDVLRRGLYRMANATAPGNVTLLIGQFPVTFISGVDSPAWQQALRLMPAPTISDLNAATRHLELMAARIVNDRAFRLRPELSPFVAWLQSQAVAQIVCGIRARGFGMRELQITGNRIDYAMLGIFVFSPTLDGVNTGFTERVVIERNSLTMFEGPDSMQYQAITVDRARSQVIERNHILGTPTNQNAWLAIGVIVRNPQAGLLLVRENHTEKVPVGVRFFERPPNTGAQWIISDNLAVQGNHSLPSAVPPALRIENNLSYA